MGLAMGQKSLVVPLVVPAVVVNLRYDTDYDDKMEIPRDLVIGSRAYRIMVLLVACSSTVAKSSRFHRKFLPGA